MFFSRKSDSRITNVRLSVCLSVTKTPQPLRIALIDHQAYWPSGLSSIETINLWSSITTFKPFGLFLVDFFGQGLFYLEMLRYTHYTLLFYYMVIVAFTTNVHNFKPHFYLQLSCKFRWNFAFGIIILVIRYLNVNSFIFE